MEASRSNSPFKFIKGYLGTPLYFNYNRKKRSLIYLSVSLLIGLVAFTVVIFLPGSLVSYTLVGLSYFLSFGIAMVIVSESRIFWLETHGAEHHHLTIGLVWVLGMIIFLVGFLLLGCIQAAFQTLKLADLDYYFDPANGFLPFTPKFLFKMFPATAVVLFLANHVVLKKVRNKKPTIPAFQFETVELTSGKNTVNLNPENISYISIDQHYASIFIRTVEGLEEVQIKSSMKTILDSLPTEMFCRIHRSHTVNLNHIDKLVNQGGNTHLRIKNSDVILPVSRRQTTEVKNRIKSFTELKLNQPAK